MLKSVIQGEVTGCGIAATAVLAGAEYQEVKQVANSKGIYADDESLWSDTSYVRKLLAEYGIECDPEEKPFTGWQSLPDKALLAIKWRKVDGIPFWHWVVFCRQGGKEAVFDSKNGLKTNIRTDFGRIKPKWFIEVLV
ncbi:conserved hypothetical protein [Marinobacter nauticus ATCC 49840]|uniref:hypothetical protein n=1 Tax=Marinobacter nauticus TaxID=2743 RepID=UPI000256E931|nr:hypothetical protein [Marinobacter nauticus]CCG95379.1 conserved hypothetical protein [Marinobacter nauticus ATCC 49840]